MKRPALIGIAGASYVVPRPWGDLPIAGASAAVVAAISGAGGVPLILPVETEGKDALGLLDGLVLTGGGDLDPRLYGSTSADALDVDRKRDDSDLALLHAAREQRLPVLGLCRGAQLMAVGFGGSLMAHLGEHNPHVILDGGHAVATSPDSVARRMLGDRVVVNSLHHQAISDPGNGWSITALADDGVPEAIERQDGDWDAFGVQWHPELSPDEATSRAVFGWLLAAAARH